MDSWREPLASRLRRRILAAIHRGGVRGGDRLPSIRSLADELSEDHRAVARAYRLLEEEGLVDVRARSGVYLAPQESLGKHDAVVSETATWLGEVLYGGWQRGLAPARLTELLSRSARRGALRPVCLESVRDPLEALASEVEQIVGADCGRTLLSPDSESDPGPVVEELLASSCDLVLTTAFHPKVRQALEEAGLPVVLLRISSEWLATIRAWADGSELTIVVQDPRTAPRLQALLGDTTSVRWVEADRLPELRPPARGRSVYATRLARPALRGRWAELARVPEASLIRPREVRALIQHLVGKSLRTDGA